MKEGLCEIVRLLNTYSFFSLMSTASVAAHLEIDNSLDTDSVFGTYGCCTGRRESTEIISKDRLCWDKVSL